MRRFENIKPELNVSKFWEIDEPTTHGFHASPNKFWLEVRWGRIGFLAQSNRHHFFLSRVEADRFVADKIKEKLTRGYVEVDKLAYMPVVVKGQNAKKLSPEDFAAASAAMAPPKPIVTGPPAACTHDNLQRWGGGFRCMVCLAPLKNFKAVPEKVNVVAVSDAPRHIELDDD